MSRNHSLDVLRAIAVLLVICHHYGTGNWSFLHFGAFGVDLFFVLSGFLISGLLFTELQTYGSISFGRFFVRRGLKIYPPFYCFLLIAGLPAPHYGAARNLAEVFFLQSYLPHIWQHTWSLSIEEIFYLGLPLLIAGLAAKNKLNSIPSISLFLLLGCLACRILTGIYRIEFDDYVQAHLRMDALFAGVTLGFLYNFKRDFFVRVSQSRYLIWVGLLFFLPEIPRALVPLSRTVFALMLTSNLLGFAAVVWWAQTRSYFRNQTLEAIGRYSYSIYLWHMPIALFWRLLRPSFLGLLGDIASSVIVGVVMAVIIESPVLRLREKFFPARSRDLEREFRESPSVLQQALPAQ
jgi:peptidoglycan/LPS O-acetylase OafA/YrhL